MQRSKGYLAGIDLGGTKIKFALFAAEGKMVQLREMETRAQEGPEAIIRRMMVGLRELSQENGVTWEEMRRLGVGCPGPLNSATGVILSPPNLSGWSEIPLKNILERELGCSVAIDNDCNVAAMGEMEFGAGKDVDSLFYLTVSTGVGGGVIIGRHLYQGWQFLAGEVGHTIVDPDGPLCNCGQRGCLEMFTSGPSLVRMVKERLKEKEDPILVSLAGGDLESLTAKEVLEAARRGSPLAREALEVVIFYLAIGILNVNHILNPQKFILGGGVGQARDLIVEPVVKKIREICKFEPFSVPIIPAALGHDSVIWGTFVLAREGWEEKCGMTEE
jgi:glucokinase